MLTVNEAEQPRVISNEFPIFLKTIILAGSIYYLLSVNVQSSVKKTLFYCSLIRVRAYSNLIVL